jgi:uncharacterized protein with PQ loop repeat
MSEHTSGLHHAHTRKRIHQKNETFPSQDKLKNMLDKAMYFIGALAPIMTIPQVYKIWIEKSGESISLLSWGTYTLVSLFWVLYGIVHKEKLLIFIHTSLFIMNGLVVLLTFLYSIT